MILESKVCKLRPWQQSDVHQLMAIANHKDIYDQVRDQFPYPYTQQDAINWINFAQEKNNPQTLFAIEYNNKLAGSIGFHFQDDIYRMNAELGYWLGHAYRKKGITKEAVRLIVDYIFSDFNINKVYAEVFKDNFPSRNILEKNGFTCEAILKEHIIKNNELKDNCIYSLLKRDWEKASENLT